MTTESPLKGNGFVRPDYQERTPEGFIEYFVEETDYMRYSLVWVPQNRRVKMEYRHPTRAVSADLTPLSPLDWTIEGTVDNTFLANLGTDFIAVGIDKKLPLEVEVEDLRKFGTIEDVDPGERNDVFYTIQLHLPVNYVYNFVANVWQPDVAETLYRRNIPTFHPGSQERSLRTFPEKRFKKISTRRPRGSSLVTVAF